MEIIKAMSAPEMKTVAELLGNRYSKEMREAFPDVTPPYRPFGYNMLLQLRLASDRSPGGVIIPDEYREGVEQIRTQAALVRAMGPVCFKNRETGVEWKEKAWCKPGDFVRSPMYGGDRFYIQDAATKSKVMFVFIKDSDAVALVTGNPLTLQNS